MSEKRKQFIPGILYYDSSNEVEKALLKIHKSFNWKSAVIMKQLHIPLRNVF